MSFRVSPFEELDVAASEKPITLPPSLFTAVSKLRRVRVDGSKNSVATSLPSSSLLFGFCSNFSAKSNMRRMYSLLQSEIDTRLFRIVHFFIYAYENFQSKN